MELYTHKQTNVSKLFLMGLKMFLKLSLTCIIKIILIVRIFSRTSNELSKHIRKLMIKISFKNFIILQYQTS